MAVGVRTIGGREFRTFRTITPGERLFLIAGRTIAVETWAVEWGQHEFDYEVNSRALDAGGRPQAIATTREALRREFVERRVVTRQPVPISVAFPGGLSPPRVELTYGEASPSIYTSRQGGAQLAWSIIFKSHRHVAAQGTIGAAKSAVTRNRNAPVVADGTAAMRSLPAGFDYLMLYLPVEDMPRSRILAGGFGVTDVIGTEQSWFDRWWTRVVGE